MNTQAGGLNDPSLNFNGWLNSGLEEDFGQPSKVFIWASLWLNNNNIM